MRFLWVEDFDSGDGRSEALKARWLKYFRLGEPVIKENMRDALMYLEDREHFRTFDAVLLDIRFPAGGDDRAAEQIYRDYFSKIITRELFFRYRDFGSGILLYLALVMRYGYNQERIAFISANVDDKRLGALTAMKSLLIKKRMGKLSETDFVAYEQRANELARLCDTQVDRGKSGRNAAGSAPDSNAQESPLRAIILRPLIQVTDPEAQIAALEEAGGRLREVYEAEPGGRLKYVTVRRQFEALGLVIPDAFEKPDAAPDGREEGHWLFEEWKAGVDTPYYRFRAGAIEMCEILRRNPKTAEPGTGSSAAFLKRLSAFLPDLPVGETAGDVREQLLNFIREAVRPGDRILSPVRRRKDDSAGRFACRAVAKIARNWISHQGIAGVTKEPFTEPPECAVSFLFIAAMRAFFRVDLLPEDEGARYREHEEVLLRFVGEPRELPEAEKLSDMLRDSFKRLLLKNRACFAGGGSTEDTSVYQLVSGIGHQKSTARDTVSFDEIIQLFWHAACEVQKEDQAEAPAPSADILRLLRRTYERAWVHNQYAVGH